MNGVLYRAWAADDELLYVGATTNPGSRLYAHGREKDWWTDVARVTLEHFETRDLALVAEREAILREKPRYNIARSGPLDPERQQRRKAERAEREQDWAEQAARQWRTDGRVCCDNCGKRPFVLPKAVAIADCPCPTCGVNALGLREEAA